jgi:hypothetical protein
METKVQQTSIPGTEQAAKKKRQSLLDKAVVGDLVVGFIIDSDERIGGIATIEQVLDGISAADIVQRWKDQRVVGEARTQVEVWECRPGGHYRRKK